MGGEAEPALAWGAEDALVAELGVGKAGVGAGFADADDAGGGGGGAVAEDFVAAFAGAVGEAVSDGEDGGGDLIDAGFEEEFEGSAETEGADDVEGAGFVASGVGAEGHVAGGVIGPGGDVGPAELDGFDLVLPVAGDEEDAGAFGAEEPFVAVGGEGVDVHGADVEGEGAEALDGVDEEEDAEAAADFADGGEVGAVAAEVLDEADGEEAGAAGGLFDLFEGIKARKPGNADAAGLLQFLPDVVVGGKFFVEGDDAVAGLPGEAEGDGGDAFAGIFDEGDFGGVGVGEAGGGGADAVAGGHPIGVVEGAVEAGVVGHEFHGIGCAAGEGGDGGVVEIDEIFGDGEFMAPAGGDSLRLRIVVTHLIECTLGSTEEEYTGPRGTGNFPARSKAMKAMRMLAMAMAVAVAAGAPAAYAQQTAEKKTEQKKVKKGGKEDVEAIGERNVGKGYNWYSLEKEIALGKGIAQEIERQARIVDDPVIAEYINRVGQNLVRNSDCQVPVTIKVIDTDEPNAMALPGGFFFVNTGLITLAENESEIAGVMGHEIAHIAARHGTRQATRGQTINLATLPLIFMGGWTGFGIRQAAGLAIPLGFLSFSRAFEEEADLLGLQYMYKAGYDPNGFVDFFERLEALEKRKPGAISKIFRSHPPTGDRITKAQANIEQLLKERPEYVVTTSEFEDVKNRILMLASRRKATPEDPNRPTLRRAPGSTDPIEAGDDPKKPKEDPDERPTLKRRNP